MSKNKSEDTFCIFPFTHLNIKPQNDSMLTFCWKSFENLGSIRSKELHELWNNEKNNTLRRGFLHGEKTEGCHRCWKLEEGGQKELSLRKRYLEKYEHLVEEIKNKYIEKGEASLPLTAEIRFSSTCNLRCLHCDSYFSSRWKTLHRENEDLKKIMSTKGSRLPNEIVTEDTIDELINDMFLELEELRVSGGEPFIDELFFYFLRKIPNDLASKISLIITTNLNIINIDEEELKFLLSKFKQVDIRVSIDGEPSMYSYLRFGGDILLIEKNIKMIRSWNIKKIGIDALFTLSTLNVTRVVNSLNYFKKLKLDFYTLFVNLHPMYLDCRTIPEELRQETLESIKNYQTNEESKNYKNELQKIIDFLSVSKYTNDNWHDFNRFIDRMDNIQGTSFFDVYPEFLNFG